VTVATLSRLIAVFVGSPFMNRQLSLSEISSRGADCAGKKPNNSIWLDKNETTARFLAAINDSLEQSDLLESQEQVMGGWCQ
jgi:hypothetical protein